MKSSGHQDLTWKTFYERYPSYDLLVNHVTNLTPLSRDVSASICGGSAIRQAGNTAAHHASQDAIREAVLGQLEGEKRLKLMRVFKFVYGVDV